MALTESVQLDIREAERQITALEAQLAGLGQPIDVPVEVTGGDELSSIRQELGLSEGSVASLNQELDKTDDVLREAGSEAKRTGSDIEQAGKQGEAGFQGLGAAVGVAAAAFVAFRAARRFLDFGRDAVQMQAALEESTSKVAVVFGDFSDEVQAFGESAPRNLNLATQAALEATGTLGNLFTALGLTQREAAELSPAIVELAADLASFNNIDASDALNKLQSGLVGQARGLRELGVNINETVVAAKAMELGLVDTAGEVDEAAKVQARYALIMEQTATAQGNLALTSESLANKTRSLDVQMEELQGAVGAALAPAFETLLDAGERLIPTLEALIPIVGGVAGAVVDTLGSLEPFAQLLGLLVQPIRDIDAAISGLDPGDDPFAVLSAGARDLFENTQAALPIVKELGTFLETGMDSATIRRAFEDFIAAIDSGQDSFEATLDLIDRFSGGITPRVLDAIIESVQFTDQELNRLLTTLLATEDIEFFFSPSDIQTITDRLHDLGLVTRPIGDFFGNAVAGVDEFEDSLEELPPTIDDVRGALADLASTDVDISSEIAQLDAQFAKLPDALSAAKDALKDEENEIVEDFGTFLSNLESELERRQAFADDIALLRAMGLENLADSFADIGLDAAAAAADAVANPQEAQRAEDALVGFAESQANAYVDAFAQSISSEPITAELVLSIIEAAGDADNDQVRAALAALAQALTFNIPIGFDIVGTGTVGQSAAQAGGVEPGGPPGGGTTVVQNFEGVPPPTPDLVRAAQAANQIIVS